MNYMKIDPCDIANGPGVRVTLFVTGCNHHCPGCHNPQTWDPNAGQPFTNKTLDKIVDLLRSDYIRGLTLTGGDPLYPENRETVKRICKRVWTEFHGNKDIWMWTGYVWEDIVNDWKTNNLIIPLISVLVDGPFIEAQKDISLPYMGSSNQRVIDIWETILTDKPVLWWASEKKERHHDKNEVRSESNH